MVSCDRVSPFRKVALTSSNGGDEDYLHRNDSNFDHTFYEFDDVEDDVENDKDGDKSSPHVY